MRLGDWLSAVLDTVTEDSVAAKVYYQHAMPLLTAATTVRRKVCIRGIAVRLWQAIRHGRHGNSHAISHHPAQVTFPPLPQPKLVL